ETGETRIFLRLAETLGKRHLRTQSVLYVWWHHRHHWRFEYPWKDRVYADSIGHQVARDGQGHGQHTTLRCRISGLSDLPVLCGDRGSVDDDSALAIGTDRLQVDHSEGGIGQASEASDEVDFDRQLELLHGIELGGFRLFVASDRLGGVGHPGAVDEDPLLPMSPARLRERCLYFVVRGHVDLTTYATS